MTKVKALEYYMVHATHNWMIAKQQCVNNLRDIYMT